MSRNHTFTISLPLDSADFELVCTGTTTPYDPGVTSGPPENCYPLEGGEVEIEEVWLEGINLAKPFQRIEISPVLALLGEIAQDRLQELVEQYMADQTPDEPDYPDYED